MKWFYMLLCMGVITYPMEKGARIPIPAPPMTDALKEHIQKVSEEDILSDKLMHHLLEVVSPRIRRAIAPSFSEALIESRCDKRQMWGVLRSLDTLLAERDTNNQLINLKEILSHTMEKYIHAKESEIYRLTCAKEQEESKRYRLQKIAISVGFTAVLSIAATVTTLTFYLMGEGP